MPGGKYPTTFTIMIRSRKVTKIFAVHGDPEVTQVISVKDYNYCSCLISILFYQSIIISPLVVVNGTQVYWSTGLVQQQYKTVWYWIILGEPLRGRDEYTDVLVKRDRRKRALQGKKI